MKKIDLLTEVDSISGFKDFLKQEEIREILTTKLTGEQVLIVAMDAMNNYDAEQEDYFLDYVHFVAKKINSKGRLGIGRELITILVGSIYIEKFYARIRCCDLLYLMAISFFSMVDSIENYNNNMEMFTRKIFDCYKEKTSDFMFYFSFNEVVRELYEEGKNEAEVVEYLSGKTEVELLQCSALVAQKNVEQGGFYI